MIHLNVQTGFSFLKAYGSPEQVVDRAKQLGAHCVGIADFGGCWGHIPFWRACQAAEIKPLFGVSLAVVPTLEGKDARFDTVTLIAKNTDGLREQYELVGLATEQFYYRPRVTWSQLKKLRDNYIIVTRITAETIKYISLLRTPYIAAIPEAGALLNLVLRGEFPVVIATGPVYPTLGDSEAYRLVNAISSGRKTFGVDESDNYMRRVGELRNAFKALNVSDEQFAGWLDATAEIALSATAEPATGTNVKPDTERTVEEWCLEGARQRGIDLTVEPYASRYNTEIGLIHEKGFTDYFLLIADLCDWAKQHMFVGPARGSSAGSLVCYLMGIVEVDPIVHGLLFERFIDVNRMDLPDVDIDFPDDKRDLVFQYIVQKYGAERVARIGTISVFKPKSALNDVAKCYSIPPWEIKKLTEVMIERSGGDARANMAIEDTIQHFEAGRELAEKFPKIMMASKIEGHPRHTGQHAAGVIIADEPVNNYFAVNRREGAYIGQINKDDAESIGLLKIDALGLKTLAVIDDCCQQVGVDPKILYTLDLDRPEAFKIFQEDRVAGIFQFEGYAVRSLMRQMGVEHFQDIVALTALARPGPLHCGAANQFIERRTDRVDWDYEYPQIQPYTGDTFGTIVYQEQVMSICRHVGKMSWADVSWIRKAMSKSLGEETFNRFRVKFQEGAKEDGIEAEHASALFDHMCTFGSWAFNLSHAVSYALISYWCAYLKANYPLEFAVAHLRRTDSQDHVLRLLRELMKEGIPLIPFDHNVSELSWSIHDGKIYGGFTAVKGIGPKTAQEYIAKRAECGEDWVQSLTPAKRTKLLAPNNTPWHNINRIDKQYAGLYADPDSYITPATPQGVVGPVCHIEEITEKKGQYCFIGTLKQRNLRDLNETQSLAKRNGRRMTHHTEFLNLTFEDDTGSILCTIDRWTFPKLGPRLMDAAADGKDFIIRGEIRSDGWRKINIQNIRRLDYDPEATPADPSVGVPDQGTAKDGKGQEQSQPNDAAAHPAG